METMKPETTTQPQRPFFRETENVELDPRLLRKEWRMKNLYWIKDRNGTVIRFVPNEVQDQFFRRRHSREIILKARQLGLCLHPDTRILMSDLSWKTLKEVAPGDRIITTDEMPTAPHSGRKMKTGFIQKKWSVFKEAFEISLSDGRKIIATEQHRFLFKARGSTHAQWRTIGDSRVGDEIRSICQAPWGEPSFEDGWFSGILDGGGSLALKSRNGASIGVSQVAGPVWDRIVSYLTDRGIIFRVESDARKKGTSSKLGNKIVYKAVVDRMDQLFYLMGITRPSRFAEREWWSGKEMPGKRSGYGWFKITSITPLGKMEMIDLQTSDQTFIAEGLVSHNSTAVSIDILDDALFTKHLSAAIVADKLENAKNIFEKIDFAWMMFPKDLKEYLSLNSESDSSTMISFTNGSSIKVGTSLHSGTFQRVHVSEYGPLCAQFPDKAEDLKKSVFPTVSQEGRITIESTAEGEGNDFHDLCAEAEARQTKVKNQPLHPLEFRFHFFPWYLNKEYQVSQTSVNVPDRLSRYFDSLEEQIDGLILSPAQRAWYALTEQTQKARMREQYPSTPEEAFLSSGDRLFSADLIKSKLETDPLPPEQVLMEGRLLIYKPYIPRHRYGVSGDPSQGIGRDSAVAQVIDFTTNEQVATFEDPNISPTEFGDILQYVGHLYGTALLAPESNNHGHATIARLVDLGYTNLYRFVVRGTLDEHETERLGWLTTQITKPRMFFELSEAFNDPRSPLIVRDEATLKEAQYYQKGETNLISPLSRKKLSRHFDRLTALAICFQLRDEAAATDFISQKQKQRISNRRNRNRSMR